MELENLIRDRGAMTKYGNNEQADITGYKHLAEYCAFYEVTREDLVTHPEYAAHILKYQPYLEQLITGYGVMGTINRPIAEGVQQ